MTSALWFSRAGTITTTAWANLILFVADRWCLASAPTTDQMQTTSGNKVFLLFFQDKPQLNSCDRHKADICDCVTAYSNTQQKTIHLTAPRENLNEQKNAGIFILMLECRWLLRYQGVINVSSGSRNPPCIVVTQAWLPAQSLSFHKQGLRRLACAPVFLFLLFILPLTIGFMHVWLFFSAQLQCRVAKLTNS